MSRRTSNKLRKPIRLRRWMPRSFWPSRSRVPSNTFEAAWPTTQDMCHLASFINDITFRGHVSPGIVHH
eukprot:1156155-Pelagomonas_calceolata.AAC.3